MNKIKANSEIYENHQHHIRGDRIAGTSFTYECLWRCRLMLRLNPLDTISVYNGEDAFITKEDGEKIYYQIKQTKYYWTPSRLKPFFQRAEEILKDYPKISYVFCTNANLNTDADKKFNEIRQKWANRLKREKWEPDLKEPLDKIHINIRQTLEKYFKPQDISWVLNHGQIRNCCNKLLALEAELKIKEENSITGDQIWERAGMKQLAEEIPSLILGERLRPWSSWIKEARIQDGDPFLSAIRSVVLDHKDIELKDLGNETFKHVSKWGKNPCKSRLLLVRGVSGTGKTWLLVRLGIFLSDQFPVYCADARSVGNYPNFRSLPSLANKPTVVLIDNLIEEDWYRFVPEALTAQPPILIIGTTSMPDHHPTIHYLQGHCGKKFISLKPLSPLLTDKDVWELINFFRQGTVSRKEQAKLAATNIRYAVRLLEDRESQSFLVNKVYELWACSDLQDWIMPLLLCSLLNVKIPRSVLREYARSKPKASLEMPNELWPMVLRSKREDDEILWLEDSSIAQNVFAIIIENDMDRETIEFSLFEATAELIGKIRVKYAPHQQFARRIVRRFCEIFPQYSVQLIERRKDTISQLIDQELPWAIAYIWLPLLSRTEKLIEARKAALRFLSKLQPQSIADVVLLTEAYGDKRIREIIRQKLKSIRKWDIELLATFIEHLTPLDRYSQRELLRLFIPFIKS